MFRFERCPHRRTSRTLVVGRKATWQPFPPHQKNRRIFFTRVAQHQTGHITTTRRNLPPVCKRTFLSTFNPHHQPTQYSHLDLEIIKLSQFPHGIFKFDTRKQSTFQISIEATYHSQHFGPCSVLSEFVTSNNPTTPHDGNGNVHDRDGIVVGNSLKGPFPGLKDGTDL